MRSAALLALVAPLALAAPSAPPFRTRLIHTIPPDLYESPHPSFAGAEIVLRDPPDPSSAAPGPGRYAIAYTPYTPDGRCKSNSTMATDVARIRHAGFSAVRLYATDCSAVAHVGAAALANELHLILGLHIVEAGIAASALPAQIQQLTDFAASSPTALRAIDAVVLGNEALFNEHTSAEELALALRSTRAALRHAGYVGPVTTTEPYATLSVHRDILCPELDAVSANLLPFFNADGSAREAGEEVAGQVRGLRRMCPRLKKDDEYRMLNDLKVGEEKPVLAMELGWPSKGLPNGEAVPGRVEQRVALREMAEAVGSRGVFSSFEDDEWRDAGDFGVETHWGAIAVFE